MRKGTPDAITASQTHFLAGNSADYREIDQAPRKDVAVCVSGMSKEPNEDNCYMKTPPGLCLLCHPADSRVRFGSVWLIKLELYTSSIHTCSFC